VSEPLLTAAMIVRDEESHLPACLQSIRDVVDEMVIVDTGSTDATVTVARSFGARVHRHPWTGDFAQARNAALELATGRWILYIDADERLRPIAPELVRAHLEKTADVALRVRLRPFAAATPYWEYRLWRSDPRIRFVGKMHEKVTMAIRDVADADRRAIGESELFLEHVGYDGDQTHKHKRNLPLLQAQLAADPVDAYSWHHLAVVLEAVGETRGSQAALEHAVDTGRASGAVTGVLGFLEQIRRRREYGQETGTLLQEALARYPDSIAVAWLKVLDEIDSGRYEQALRTLERFDVDPEMPVEDTAAYRSELFGPRAAEARGVCLFKLGRDAEAAEAYAQAQAFEPDEPAHRLKRVLAERRAARRSSPGEPAPGPRSNGGYRWAARALLNGLAIDLGGVSVGLSATDSVRASAIRGLLGRMAPSDQDPAVHLSFGGHRAPAPERVPDDSVGAFEIWHDDDAIAIAHGPRVGGRVQSGRATLGGYAPDLGQLFRHMGPFLLAALLGPHDRFLLHGGAIQREGSTVLVLGGSGAGKSTLVLGAVRDGWTVLSDDLVVVRSGPAGPIVSGIPKALAVPADVVGGGVPIGPSPDPRARIELPYEAWDSAWRAVTAVVMPGHGEHATATIEPIERPELLGALVHSMLSRRPTDVRAYFGLAAALSDLPACRLLHTRTPQRRAEQAAAALAARLAS
jgi:tetratricopeptide (TPR) repeat protein